MLRRLLLLPLATCSVLAAPPQAPANGVITGVVVDGATGAAVGAAAVTLSAMPGLPRDANRRQR